MAETVYFYVVDPGALEIMSAIVRAAPGGIRCRWVGEGYAEGVLLSKNEEVLKIDGLLNNKNSISTSEELIILGAQWNVRKTEEVMARSRHIGLKTVFMFDYWCNYATHFASSDDTLILPDRIFIMDEVGKANLISAGIPESYISIVGHPSIEEVITTFNSMDKKNRDRIRLKMGIKPKEKLVLLALTDVSNRAGSGMGYDEYSITLSTVQALLRLKYPGIALVVRPHPLQNRGEYYRFLIEKKLLDNLILCPENVSEIESLAAADVVLGMTSVFLIHARAVGKPALSLQLNRTAVSDAGAIPHLEAIAVTDPEQLDSRISEKLERKIEPPLPYFNGSSLRVWHEIESMIHLV